MSGSIRIRNPIDVEPPEFTVEWYSVGGDGSWVVLENGRVRSFHTFKWQARKRAKWLREGKALSPAWRIEQLEEAVECFALVADELEEAGWLVLAQIAREAHAGERPGRCRGRGQR